MLNLPGGAPAQDESDHLTAAWEILDHRALSCSGADYEKQSRALVIVFRHTRLGAGLPHSGQDSLVARDSRNLGSQAARHEKKCASHKLDVDIPRVLKIKLG